MRTVSSPGIHGHGFRPKHRRFLRNNSQRPETVTQRRRNVAILGAV